LGITKRKQQYWDVEVVFENIKHNINFKRFMLRGIDNVNVKIELIAMENSPKKNF